MKDYKKVEKMLMKKGCFPSQYWNPFSLNLQNNDLTMLLSERSLGKTTAMLLYGLALYKEYGTIMHYIRERAAHLNRAYTKTLFTTIIENNYISKIFNDTWNDVFYNVQERKWFLRKIDENGITLEVSNEAFMVGLSCDNSDSIKSSYVCSKADYIILDEFCSQSYHNYFLDFYNIVSTLVRERSDIKIVLLSNTIDINHWIFDEFNVRDIINTLEKGQVVKFKTEAGMSFYIEFCSHDETTKRKRNVNQHVFGFKNDKLSAITGTGWQIKNYKHITDMTDYRIIANNVAVAFNNSLLSLDVCVSDNATFIYCHKRTRLYNDTIVYMLNLDEINNRKKYAFGSTKFDKRIWNMIKNKKVLYDTNRSGELLDAYIKKVKLDKYQN